MVPPVGITVLLLPSEPVTVTPVAFIAATVNVDEPPAATVVGLAVTVTVAAVAPAAVVPALAEPHPATKRSGEQIITIAMSDSIDRNRETRRGRETRTFTMGESFYFSGER
jgi:hypothetical protein